MASDFSVVAFNQRLKDCLIPDGEFADTIGAMIRDPALCAGHAIRLKVECTVTGNLVAEYTSDNVPNSESTERRSLSKPGAEITCSLESWPLAERPTDLGDFSLQLAEAINRHWSARVPGVLLPYLQTAGVPACFLEYAHAMGRSESSVAVLHTDLDGFKAVNAEFEESGGNDVLREFATRFRDAFGKDGVVVRTGGEEFSGILPYSSLTELLERVEAFRERMAKEPFKRLNRPNTCSIGLAVHPDARWMAHSKDYDSILQHARSAEMRAKADGKNCIRLMSESFSDDSPQTPAPEMILLGILDARSQLHNGVHPTPQDDFKEAITKILTTRVVAAQLKDLPEVVSQLRRALGVQISSDLKSLPKVTEPLGALLTPLQWAMLVARSLLLGTFHFAHPMNVNDQLAFLVDEKGALSLEIVRQGKVELELPLHCAFASGDKRRYDIGLPIYKSDGPKDGLRRWLPEAPESSENDPLSSVLLLPIGDEAAAIIKEFRRYVGAIVDVDDRPVKGGGLPDFWQSNVSRIVSASLRNPNIDVVLAVGSVENAKFTMQRIENVGEDSNKLFDLQRRIRISADYLTVFRERRLRIVNAQLETNSALKVLVEEATRPRKLDIESRPWIDLSEEGGRRRLPIPTPREANRLAVVDGLRTGTLADAYPLAVQLIRSRDTEMDYTEASKRSFRELSGFKVVLQTPANDTIPDYWREDQKLLEDYYARNFLSEEGLFGRGLKGSFGTFATMLDFAVQSTTAALVNRQPTRRINLPIVPTHLDQPLGLSTIQIMPRIRGDRNVVDLLWVWRTVDALIGFPFSAYGSIRWSVDFVEMVRKELQNRFDDRNVEVGDLTYIALSFHMYLHGGDMEIARAIVQDASR